MQSSPAAARSNAFRQVATPLANELLASLEAEHIREVVQLYEEQLMIREELRRAVEVMQRDMIPRERVLHDMFDKLTSSYLQATAAMQAQHAEHHARAQQGAAKHEATRRQLLDPLVETENELARIQSMLMQPVVVNPDLPQSLVQKAQQQALAAAQSPSARSPPSRINYGSPSVSGATRSPPPPSAASSLFNQLDRNQDGVIDRRELRDGLRAAQNFQQVL